MDHPDWGFAVPLKLMKKDLDIIKNLGAMPFAAPTTPTPIFLDLLDGGICSGREAHGVSWARHKILTQAGLAGMSR